VDGAVTDGLDGVEVGPVGVEHPHQVAERARMVREAAVNVDGLAVELVVERPGLIPDALDDAGGNHCLGVGVDHLVLDRTRAAVQ